jgi:hypothetical protein
MWPPFSDLNSKPSKKPAPKQMASLFLSQLIFSTLKIEVICYSETSVDTQRTTRLYIPDDGTFNVTTVSSFSPGRSHHNAQWVWSSPLAEMRGVGCVWVITVP